MLELIMVLSLAAAPVVGIVFIIKFIKYEQDKSAYLLYARKLNDYRETMNEHNYGQKISVMTMNMYRDSVNIWNEIENNRYYKKGLKNNTINRGFNKDNYLKEVFGKFICL